MLRVKLAPPTLDLLLIVGLHSVAVVLKVVILRREAIIGRLDVAVMAFELLQETSETENKKGETSKTEKSAVGLSSGI